MTIILGLLPSLLVPGMLWLFPQTVWPAVFTYHTFCLGVPLLFRHRMSNTGAPRTWLPLTIALSILVLLVSVLVARFGDVRLMLPDGWQTLPARLQPFAMYAIYSLLVNPFAEEYFWRSFLLPHTGILLGGLLFWMYHVLAAMLFTDALHAVFFTLAVLFCGMIWGWMCRRFQSIWPCVITHLAADAATLISFSQVM